MSTPIIEEILEDGTVLLMPEAGIVEEGVSVAGKMISSGAKLAGIRAAEHAFEHGAAWIGNKAKALGRAAFDQLIAGGKHEVESRLIRMRREKKHPHPTSLVTRERMLMSNKEQSERALVAARSLRSSLGFSKLRASKRRVRKKSTAIGTTGHVILYTVLGSQDPTEHTVRVNPGLPTFCPLRHLEARLYERWGIGKIELTYVPTISMLENSGSITVSWADNAYYNFPDNVIDRDAMTYAATIPVKGSTTTTTTSSGTNGCHVLTIPGTDGENTKYVRRGTVPGDLNVTDHGKIGIYISGCNSAYEGKQVGYLRMSYRGLEFKNFVAGEPVWGGFDSAVGVAIASPFGVLSSAIMYGDVPTTTMNVTLVEQIPGKYLWIQDPGTYLVDIDYTGTSLAAATASTAVGGCVVINETSEVNAAGTALKQTMLVLVQDLGGFATTLGAGTFTDCHLRFTEVASDFHLYI